MSRLTQLTQDLAGTAQDLTIGLGYNPAGQIASRSSSNDAYGYAGAYNVDRGYVANGLNQYTQSGTVAPTYDARGNLTSAGGATYGYTSENRLATTSGGYAMTYDPLGRYHWIANGPITWMQYDGADVIEERDGNGVTKRYVFGPGTDEPLVWYEGSGTADRRWLHADERGSVIAVTNGAGSATAINTYDEYGIPGVGNVGRFQYTGQQWIPELGMYDFKARIYSPTMGRFMQTDPIGYGDGLNWYNYVGGDPVNATDPSGMQAGAGETPALQCPPGQTLVGTQTSSFTGKTIAVCAGDIVVTASRGSVVTASGDIVVTAPRWHPPLLPPALPPIDWPRPIPIPAGTATPEPEKSPPAKPGWTKRIKNYFNRCINKAAGRLENGKFLQSGISLSTKQANRMGSAASRDLIGINAPFDKDSMTVIASLPIYELGYSFGASCPSLSEF